VTRLLNISAYLFTEIPDAPALAAALKRRAEAARVRGTVIVAAEGINLFLAGEAEAVRGVLDALRTQDRFAALRAKESWSSTQPFRKLRVKVKGEIIRMDRPAVRPGDGRAPSVTPATLRRWLDRGTDDAGREVVLLDTRNAFEVEYGSFDAAMQWGLERFTQFPDAAAAHRAQLQGKTVVSFCTGGIRCEKAALVLRDEGVDAYQLDGGILGYLEEEGAAHWRGECFVFDGREALTAELEPTSAPRRT
jgi:UPF0176 protein